MAAVLRSVESILPPAAVSTDTVCFGVLFFGVSLAFSLTFSLSFSLVHLDHSSVYCVSKPVFA